jgi:DNA-binding transcriptional LysR family regulator
MGANDIKDIQLFLAVARERSFTRAAAKLGMTQSALSHVIRTLESRLRVRLLTRTTRSVSPTEAGERLLQHVAPLLQEIETELVAITDMGDKPAGTVRITAIEHVVDDIVWPRIAPLLRQYPDLHVEISSDYRMVDIAAERYDIGIRYGDLLEKDMIAVRLTADEPMMIVGSPAYFEWHRKPDSLQDLMKHNCITLRLASSGGLYAWELQHEGRPVEVKVRGQAVFTSSYSILNAALSGTGLAFLPESLAGIHVREGRLLSVMSEWCPQFPGLHAYYPNRRNTPRAATLVIDALRREPDSIGP